MTKYTLENLETITLMVEITLKKLYEAIIDDPNVQLGSYVLFSTINIEDQIKKQLRVKKAKVISIVQNIFEDKVKRSTINDLAGRSNRRKRKLKKLTQKKLKQAQKIKANEQELK